MAKIPKDAVVSVDAPAKEAPGRQKIPIDAHVEVEDPNDPKNSALSYFDSGARGALQGATLSFGDEGEALKGAVSEYSDQLNNKLNDALGITALGKKLAPAIGFKVGAPAPTDERSPLEIYRQLRDDIRAKNQQAEENHPWVYGASELAGGLAVPIPGGAAVKGATRGARLARAAGTGLALGGVIGAGRSDADLTRGDVGGFAEDTAKSAAVGIPAAIGGEVAGSKLGKLLDHFGEGRVDSAGRSALKAVGLKPGITDQAAALKIDPAEIPRYGNELIDEGYVKFFGGKEGVRDQALAKMNEHGAAKGAALRSVDEKLGQPGMPLEFDYERAAREALDSLGPLDPAQRAAAKKVFAARDQILEAAVRPRPEGGEFVGADKLLHNIRASINYESPDGMLSPAQVKQLTHGMREAIQRQVGDIDSDAAREIVHANYGFRQAKQVEKMAKSALSREDAKTAGAPNLVEAGLAGVAAGHPGVAVSNAVGFPFLKSLLKSRGPAAYAVANRKLGDLLKAGPDAAPSFMSKTAALLAGQRTDRQAALKDAYETDPEVRAEVDAFLK